MGNTMGNEEIGPLDVLVIDDLVAIDEDGDVIPHVKECSNCSKWGNRKIQYAIDITSRQCKSRFSPYKGEKVDGGTVCALFNNLKGGRKHRQ